MSLVLLPGMGLAAANVTAEPIVAHPPMTQCVSATETQTLWEEIEPGQRCRVVAFRAVPGTHTTLFYQQQAYDLLKNATDTAPAGIGIVLLAKMPAQAAFRRVAGWAGSNAWIERPRQVRTQQGSIVVIPMTAQASMHPTYDAVLRIVAGKWTPVRTDRWQVKIPQGLSQRHGNAMDWPHLRAFGAMWKQGDPECCPTGGTYIAHLRLDHATLRLASVRYSRHDLPFP
ncbi:hypothetical protein KZX46_02015 (plasmid) [Polymorphobacter sp. PAMC 29334]|uniref:hypothetical protein n=1 Tax=Polymorphobacter sp. PAMC 29334 TaxID=2862331 RepID=UPI001C77F4F5|nr:hypothetical protein [Polymorphobacter sp. PAMC 29334]QYE32950.1 hypothetical protein KZX46_02015 [Polymorphobacter sp. PAMC 29334]